MNSQSSKYIEPSKVVSVWTLPAKALTCVSHRLCGGPPIVPAVAQTTAGQLGNRVGWRMAPVTVQYVVHLAQMNPLENDLSTFHQRKILLTRKLFTDPVQKYGDDPESLFHHKVILREMSWQGCKVIKKMRGRRTCSEVLSSVLLVLLGLRFIRLLLPDLFCFLLCPSWPPFYPSCPSRSLLFPSCPSWSPAGSCGASEPCSDIFTPDGLTRSSSSSSLQICWLLGVWALDDASQVTAEMVEGLAGTAITDFGPDDKVPHDMPGVALFGCANH